MEDRDKKTELLVGLFLTVGLAMIGMLILQFGAVRDLFKGSYHLRVSFPDASGIKDASPVVLGGARIGKVRGKPVLNETFTGVIIDLEIFQGVQVPASAKFRISTSGLMGDSFIDIRPTGEITDQFIEPGMETLIMGDTSGGLSDLQNSADRIAKQISDVIDKDLKPALQELKEGLGKVNKGALSDETIAKFKNSMSKLDSTLTRVDEKILGDENAANLKASIADVKEAAASFKSSAKEVEASSKKLGPMFDKLDPAIAKVEKVVGTADDALKSIKSGADSFAAFTKKLNTSDGLLNALMSDPQLKDDFKDLISNMRRRGVIFYKDDADKRAAEEQTKKGRPPSPIGRLGR